ncbi:MAG: hypothetical protein AAGA27_08600 [Pseudomonadota bacterium]
MRNVFVFIMVVLAIVVAILAVTLPAEKLTIVGNINHFFMAMLPILGVAALVNYSWKSCCCPMKKNKED